jgi:hypothetical protein
MGRQAIINFSMEVKIIETIAHAYRGINRLGIYNLYVAIK